MKTQKLQLRLDLFNVLNLVNYKWGGYDEIINTTLYNVKKYDAASDSYQYQVNQNAGTKRKVTTPYNMQIGLKYSF